MPWRTASSHRPRLERLDIPQDRHQPALVQPGDDLAGPRAMLAQAGQARPL